MTDKERLKLMIEFYNATHKVKLQLHSGVDVLDALAEMRVLMGAMNMKTYRAQDANVLWPPIGHIIEYPGVGSVTCLANNIYTFDYKGDKYYVLKLSETTIAMNGSSEIVSKLYEVLPGNGVIPSLPTLGVPKAAMALAHVILYNAVFYVECSREGTIICNDNITSFSSEALDEMIAQIDPNVIEISDDTAYKLQDTKCLWIDKTHVLCHYPVPGPVDLFRLRVGDCAIPFVLVGNKVLLHDTESLFEYAEDILKNGKLCTDASMPSVLKRIQQLGINADCKQIEVCVRSVLQITNSKEETK